MNNSILQESHRELSSISGQRFEYAYETSSFASWIPFGGDKTNRAWIPWRGTQNPRVTVGVKRLS
jgi:hypothetical protein